MDETKSNESEKHLPEPKRNSGNILEQTVKLITLATTLTTVIYGVFTYSDKKEEEFKKVFWEKRFDVYETVVELAATIATSENLDSVEFERQEFWKLYWGRLSILETQGVLNAMVEYGEHLKNLEQIGYTDSKLKRLSWNLARACRISLQETWEPVKLDNIVKKDSLNESKTK